jgi:Mrp family chromosome partitioning ATPase
MTSIEKALELAKQMGQMRQREAAPEARRNRAVHADPAAAARPRENYAPFPVIEFNAQACTKNHVLVSDAQPAGAGGAAAAYRLLRGRLAHRLKDIGSPCIGITSAGPGEGKTLTALNLSIHLAHDKQNTVYLLDLDMRNPSVFRTVGARPTQDLSGYLAGRLTPEDVLFGTSLDNLVIAGVGDPTLGASELLASPRLDELLDYIRRRSPRSFIICDLPPVLSTDEPLVVAPRTDCILLIVSEGITRRDRLARAVDMLGDFTVVGIVVNRSMEESGAEYYGY